MPKDTGTRAGRTAPRHTHPSQVPLTSVMSALSDPVRVTIVRALAMHPDWSMTCGSFDVPVGKATRSHHFTVLREAGLIEQRDEGTHRINRLRREEVDGAFPGLIDLVLRSEFGPDRPPQPAPAEVD